MSECQAFRAFVGSEYNQPITTFAVTRYNRAGTQNGIWRLALYTNTSKAAKTGQARCPSVDPI